MRTVMLDVECTFYLGGLQGPSGPSYGAGTNVMTHLQSVTFDDTGESVDVSGGGDTRKSVRITQGSTKVALEMHVGHLGELTAPVGYYAKVVTRPSVYAAAMTFEGVISGNSGAYKKGSANSQTITLECDAE